MDIIVLTGNSNTGKTTTLNLLFEKMSNLNNVEILKKNEIEGNNDFSAILKCGPKKIGIISYGDYIDDFIKVFDSFEKEQLDILICSSRNKETENSVFQFIFNKLASRHSIKLVLRTFPTNELNSMAENIANAIIVVLQNKYLNV